MEDITLDFFHIMVNELGFSLIKSLLTIVDVLCVCVCVGVGVYVGGVPNKIEKVVLSYTYTYIYVLVLF